MVFISCAWEVAYYYSFLCLVSERYAYTNIHQNQTKVRKSQLVKRAIIKYRYMNMIVNIFMIHLGTKFGE